MIAGLFFHFFLYSHPAACPMDKGQFTSNNHIYVRFDCLYYGTITKVVSFYCIVNFESTSNAHDNTYHPMSYKLLLNIGMQTWKYGSTSWTCAWKHLCLQHFHKLCCFAFVCKTISAIISVPSNKKAEMLNPLIF